MRYVLLLLLLIVIGLRSDLGESEQAHAGELQPAIFAASFGSQ